jgi:hypothetical protein
MGQQYNKIEKRRRLQNYRKRLKAKAKGAAAAGAKPKAKRPPKKKAAEPAS